MNLSGLFLKRSTYIYVALLVYMCAFFIFLNVSLYSEYRMVSEIVSSTKNKSFLIKDISCLTFENIFWNNELYIIKNYIGLISLGIYPLILLIFNGGFLGMMIGTTIPKTGITFVISHTLPHSFEIIPVILSAADSIFLGVVLALRYTGLYYREIKYKQYFVNFVLYTIIIAMAALCEAYITPKIV